jgi:hypothetical protein
MGPRTGLEEVKIFFILSEIEPGRPARKLFAIPTELSRIMVTLIKNKIK